MKTMSRIAIVAAVAFWTLWVCERHARADADQCTRSLTVAAENVQLATAADAECWNPEECALAAELLASAQRQHTAALALCPAPVAREYVAPFESDADPFEAVAATSPSPDPAWCAVMGGCE